MAPRILVAVAAAVAVTLLATTAAADPATDAAPVTAPDAGPAEPEAIAPDAEPIKVKSPSLITTDGGTTLRLPPGRFVPEGRWSTLDLELRRLQDAETRLVAENASLMGESSGWGWGTVTMVLGGVALGVAGGYWLSER